MPWIARFHQKLPKGKVYRTIVLHPDVEVYQQRFDPAWLYGRSMKYDKRTILGEIDIRWQDEDVKVPGMVIPVSQLPSSWVVPTGQPDVILPTLQSF